MDFTRVDLTIKGMKETLNGVADVHLRPHGRWKIDEESGKTLCRIEVKIPSKGIAFNFIPSDDFCEELVDKMLQADLENDTYEYKNPKIDPTRPAQLGRKVERLLKILEKWRVRANIITQSTTSQDKPSPKDFYAKQLDGTWRRKVN